MRVPALRRFNMQRNTEGFRHRHDRCKARVPISGKRLVQPLVWVDLSPPANQDHQLIPPLDKIRALALLSRNFSNQVE